MSQAETLITQRKESIKLLDDFLKSTFLEMFGDPVKNEKGWDRFPLKKFGKIITGNTPPRGDIDNYSTEFIEWIKTDNITNGNLFATKASEFLSEKGLKKSRYVEKGALLVACIAGSIESVGRACLTDRRVSFNQQINAIQPNNHIDSFFLYYLFKMAKAYIQNHAAKGMKKILTKGEFEKIVMIRPPIELQNQFAAIAEKTEALKKEYRESLRELEQLFGSLSQRAFKGELELSNLEIAHLMPLPTEDSEPLVIKEEPKEKEVKTKPIKKGEEKPEQKRTWDEVSSQGVSEWVKKRYQGYHFSSEMLMRFLRKKYLTIVNYHSSEELKKYPRLHGTQDFKEFIFSAVSKENPFLKLEQVFYNAEQENIPLQITEEDFELIKTRPLKERSGIYFKIVEN